MNSSYYYLYLFKISWPALSLFLAVYIFLILRLILAARNYYRRKTNRRPFSLALRLVLTIGVLIIYTQLFTMHYGDWFCRPSFGQGLVTNLQQETGDGSAQYYVIIQNGEELLRLSIDHNTYQKLQPNDFVQLSYLPLKKEVFYVRVLTPQVVGSI
ncbi:MAG: hypothetical protein GX207_00215 [Peptococcaceae bacterium]|nr:hypothetical protein [Peptococcaceae bacterium]